jgi:hypothetical protein
VLRPQECCRPSEGRLSSQHLEEHAPEGVEIGTAVENIRFFHLLRAHVSRRADRDPRLRDPFPASHVERAGNPEVRHHGVTLFEQDVFWFDVAVDQPLRVRVGERARHFPGDQNRVVERQLLFLLEPSAERLTLHERRDEIDETGRLARIEHGEDVGVCQAGRDLDLAKESRVARQSGQLGPEDLDRDGALVTEIGTKEYRRGSPTADFSIDRVAASQGISQTVQRIRHGFFRPRLGATKRS